MQKSFYDANRTRHCREIYLPQTSLSEVDTSPQKRHRWRCRLIPSVLGAPRGDFFTIPAQNLAYGMRYNAGNGGVQLSVNLISRLEEERPTRLYACREWIRTPDQALGNSRFSRLGHPGGLYRLLCETNLDQPKKSVNVPSFKIGSFIMHLRKNSLYNSL